MFKRKMNLQFYLEKLYASEDFQKFIEENKDAYLCSCFFVIDFEKEDNKQHFDYFVLFPAAKPRPPIPATDEINSQNGRIFSFQIEKGCEKVDVENFGNKVPEEISDNYNFDFKDIEKLISERMEGENIKNKIQKILFSLQRVDGKEVLLGTIFISALGMIKIRIDLENMKVVEFEKKSFLDMFKVVKKKD